MALGHPKGLFPLFFTEMWERLAFYTMVGILLLYTTDAETGGLGLPDAQGNEIYGLYLAFVYFTPFLGGMIADRFLGYRRSVAVGGVLMATGLFMMGMPGFTYFVAGLTALVIGNGFFKPNISVMVGNLYEPGDPKRDSGFNIFYMGINVGALVATLIAAPIARNTLGWGWTFRIAGIGVLLAVVILATQWRGLARADRQPEQDPDDTSFSDIMLKIIGPAFVVGGLGYWAASAAEFTLIRPAVCGFLAGMLPVIFFFVRMGLTAREDERPGLLALLPIYIAGGAFFMILHLNGSAMTQWARDYTDRQADGAASALTAVLPGVQHYALPSYYTNAGEDVPLPDPRTLGVVASSEVANMYGQQKMDAAAVDVVAALDGIEVRQIKKDEVVDDEWSNLATAVYGKDQNGKSIVTVSETQDAHGAPVISVSIPDGATPDRDVVFLREVDGKKIAVFVIDQQAYQDVYAGYEKRFGHTPKLLPPGEFMAVINPEVYQSWNPFWVIFLTPVVVAFFQWRLGRGSPIPTARKLLYGMMLTTAALLLMSLAGLFSNDGTDKVSGLWLMSFYMLVTFGELCLSPMGLSLVTKLSPKRLVGLTMGGWFMATAFGNNFSGFFGGIQHLMSPVSFFLLLAGLSGLVALFIFAVLPKLNTAITRYGA